MNVVKQAGRHRIVIIVLPKNYILHEKLKILTFSRFEVFLCCLKPFYALWSLFGYRATKRFSKNAPKCFGNPKTLFESRLTLFKKLEAIWLWLSSCQKIISFMKNWKNGLFSRFEAFLCCLQPFWAVWSLLAVGLPKNIQQCSKILWQP